MFESLFRNAEEIPEKPTTIAEDVQWILEHTNYTLLSIAWDEFVRILRIDPNYDEDEQRRNLHGRAAYPWYALTRLHDFNGELTQFPIEKMHLLHSLKEGYIIYDEIMHVLIDHHADEKEAQLLFATHPNLHAALPQEYDNAQQVMEVLVEVVRLFRWELERFSEKHSDAIIAAKKTIGENYLKSLKTKN